MKTNNMKISTLDYDWRKVNNGVSKYIKVDKGGRRSGGFAGGAGWPSVQITPITGPGI